MEQPHPKFNRAAGTRHLGARSHARLLDEQTDAFCVCVRGEERLIKAGKLLAEVLVDLRAAQSHLHAANERASSAEYTAPTGPSMRLAAA